LLQTLAGTVLLLGGFLLCFLPGPGLPLIAVGASLLVTQSRTAARVLDWSEVKVRTVMAWGVRWWNHASKIAKYAVVMSAASGLALAGYGTYQLLLAR
jgi:hypothetical protein